MKTKLLFTCLHAFLFICRANAQCHYIPATSTATDTLSYSFSGGAFQSFGCVPIDPTYWITGNGNSVTITFVVPQAYPSFRVWGLNDDDNVSVKVNGVSYPLNLSSASYDPKVVCGLSPGPDGVMFSGGNLVGVNTNNEGNYSYQNIQLSATNVTSITINGNSGLGWGLAGASVNCPFATGIDQPEFSTEQILISPNPFSSVATISFNSIASNTEIAIFNLYGQKIRTLNAINSQQLKINRDNLPAGIYFICVTQNGLNSSIKKFVIADE